MDFFVKLPNGKQLFLEVELTETIDLVKTIIERKTGIPPGEQSLTFENKELENRDTVQRCLIQRDLTVPLILELRRVIQIFVKPPTGRHIMLDVEPTDRIEVVKAKIEAKEGIPRSEQRLMFANKELEDGNTVQSCSLERDVTVPFVLQFRHVIHIFVKTPSGKHIPVEIDPTDRIEFVKTRIEEKLGFPPDQQRLMFAGKQLDDGKTVQDYSIQDSSILQVVLWFPLHMHICVRLLYGKAFMLEVVSTDRIGDVIEMIHEKEGLPPDGRLIFYGRELDNCLTLQDCSIPDGSLLHYVRRFYG
jgi:ubiquitin C